MRRRRPIMAPIDVADWRRRIVDTTPACGDRTYWVQQKLNRCESDLERAFVMLFAVSTFQMGHISFAGEWPPDSVGRGKRYELNLDQQVKIAKYRCDFVITVRSVVTGRTLRIAIECDGHSFHDRTPEQASSDRRRDRQLLAEGIATIRYTFSDVVRSKPAEFITDLHKTLNAIATSFCDREEAQ